MSQTMIPTPEDLISGSKATDAFRAAFKEFRADFAPSEHIHFPLGNPPVKVMRALCGLLEKYPELAIEHVEVNGRSGCSSYHGEISVNRGAKRFEFVWDCAWRAKQEGIKDFLGFPDQQRAVRQFGYRCFKEFRELG